MRWTNTRFVCIHLSAFFMLNPNMGIKIQILLIEMNSETWNNGVCCVHLALARKGLSLLVRLQNLLKGYSVPIVQPVTEHYTKIKGYNLSTRTNILSAFPL